MLYALNQSVPRASNRGMRNISFVLLAGLVACGGSELTLPDDPCALVTVEEVEAAIESTVVKSGLVPDERLRRPQDSNPCEYVTDGKHTSITLYVYPHGAADFALYRDRDPPNTEAIAGLGDEAFTFGRASLYVRIGDGYFVLTTQHGAGLPGVRDLQRLARSALDRLDSRDAG